MLSTGEFVDQYNDLGAAAPGNPFLVSRSYGNQRADNPGFGSGWDSAMFARLATDGQGNVDLNLGDLEAFNNTISRLIHRACGMRDTDYLFLKLRQESLPCVPQK